MLVKKYNFVIVPTNYIVWQIVLTSNIGQREEVETVEECTFEPTYMLLIFVYHSH